MYVRQIDDRELTFQVSGKLWKRSLIMRDIETGTEWSHILGRAMAGKFMGSHLKPIVSDMLTWSAWRKAHPDTTVLNMPRSSRNYSSEVYRHATEYVLGFQVAGKPRALPLDKLLETPVHNFQIGKYNLLSAVDREGVVVRLFDATVDGKRLTFRQDDELTMRDDQTDSEWSVVSGEAVTGELRGTRLKQRVGIMSFRRAWQNFHPDSIDISF